MKSVVATAGLEAADKISGVGFQLVMIASVALFLGAMRLVLAKRSTARLLLAAGTFALSIGVTVLLLESYGTIELDYYPEWKKDFEATDWMTEEDIEAEELYFSGPGWWEGPLWWGERLLRLAGIALATAGFYLEARTLLREGSRRAS